MNPQFQQIGETFVKQYFEIFDADRDGREKLACFYHVSRPISLVILIFIKVDLMAYP